MPRRNLQARDRMNWTLKDDRTNFDHRRLLSDVADAYFWPLWSIEYLKPLIDGKPSSFCRCILPVMASENRCIWAWLSVKQSRSALAHVKYRRGYCGVSSLQSTSKNSPLDDHLWIQKRCLRSTVQIAFWLVNRAKSSKGPELEDHLWSNDSSLLLSYVLMLNKYPSVAFQSVECASDTDQDLAVSSTDGDLLGETDDSIQIERTCNIERALLIVLRSK